MLRVSLFFLAAASLYSQPGTITTIAGNYSQRFGLQATQVQLARPQEVTTDPDGNLYVLENSIPWIRRVDRSGIVYPFAGTGLASGQFLEVSGAPAQTAEFFWLTSIAIRKDGAIVFADGRNKIYEIGKDGRVRIIAGTVNGYFGDGGPAIRARLGVVRGLIEDSDGNLLFCDISNNRVRKISPDGIIDLVAGNGQAEGGGKGDGGPAIEAPIFNPRSIAFLPDGSLLIADTWYGRIRRVDSAGIITTVAGNGSGFAGDGGPATEAKFSNIESIATDPAGRIYVCDAYNQRIRVIETDGKIRTLVGGGQVGDPGAGIAPELVKLGYPTQVHVGADGRLFITEYGNQMVLLLEDGMVRRYMGTTLPGSNSTPAAFSPLTGPGRVAATADGTLYFSGLTNRIYRLGEQGTVEHFAGNGTHLSTNRTVPNLEAALAGPGPVIVDPSGDLSVAAYFSSVVRIGMDGNATRFAGTFTLGSTGDDGPATQATLNGPAGIAYDAKGNLYVAEDLSYRIRKVTPDGIISAFAGLGFQGYGGDNGPAGKALFGRLADLAFDPSGNLYVADQGNYCIRKIDQNGIVTTVAGTGVWGFEGDGGPATKARMRNPSGVAVDADGNLYIADRESNRIRKVDRAGIITTFAGDGAASSLGDGGPATQASLHAPHKVSFDRQGNLLISELGGNRIRKVQGYAPYILSPQGLQFNFALNAPAESRSVSLTTFDSDPRGFSLSTDVPWLRATAAPTEITISSPSSIVVTANPAGLAKGRYLGRVLITDLRTGDKFPLPVTITVSGTPQQLRLGQTGFTFVTLEGSTASIQQSLSVLNSGTGSLSWTATSSTLQGGAWLAIASASGVSAPGAPAAPIRLSVNPNTLGPGVYYGLITVNAPQADNAPQSAIVILNVLAASTPPGPQLDSSGVLFNVDPALRPEAKTVQLLNLSGTAVNYTASLTFPDSRRWLTLSPAFGQISGGQGAPLALTPNITGLAAGIYRATLNVAIQPGNVNRSLPVVLVIPPSGSPNAAFRSASADCQPKSLVPVFRSPGAGYFTNAGWPANVEIEVVNDCGQPVTQGRAAVSFSTGEAQITLNHSGQGRWSGTWISRAVNQNSSRLTLRVESDAPALSAQAELTIGVRQNTQQPIIEKSGIRSLATMRADEPLASGSFAAILGSGLASAPSEADQFPLPAQLRDTRVVVAGRVLPLRKTAEGRIEAFLPQGLPEFTPLQLIVQRGPAYSVPEPLVLVGAAPAVFSEDGTGRGQGLIYVDSKVADGTRPAHPGEDIQLFASGLGPVETPPAPGAAAPSDPLLAVQGSLSLMIEDQPAVIKEAVLAPGLVGIYRITATVPDEVKSTGSARVVLTANDIPSPPVTLAVQAAQ